MGRALAGQTAGVNSTELQVWGGGANLGVYEGQQQQMIYPRGGPIGICQLLLGLWLLTELAGKPLQDCKQRNDRL